MTASAWLTIPSARPVAEVAELVEKWSSLGYGVALWRDEPERYLAPKLAGLADIVLSGQYPGYAQAVNALIREVARHPEAEWFIAGGDDTLPDPDHAAEEIAAQCCEHFAGAFGVMQPTGDRFAQGQIDRIAGSAWIGREFARRAYGGNGPLWAEYTHMFVDEELKCVAEKYGVYWMRPDLVQLHMHWQRESAAIDANAIGKPESARPAHMHPSNNDGYTGAHWMRYKGIFMQRKAAQFPGSELL